jgi:hypothetical protein
MKSWKNAAFIISGFVLIAVSGIMGSALYKLDVGFVQIINWRDIIIFSTTATVGFVMLILGIRNLIRLRQHSA